MDRTELIIKMMVSASNVKNRKLNPERNCETINF